MLLWMCVRCFHRLFRKASMALVLPQQCIGRTSHFSFYKKKSHCTVYLPLPFVTVSLSLRLSSALTHTHTQTHTQTQTHMHTHKNILNVQFYNCTVNL